MIYFLIPVYNESLNIQTLSLNIINTLPDLKKFYLFVDDKSTDNTVDLINKHFESENFHIIIKEQNLGPGDSFNKGFEWLLEKSNNESEIVITMEADNTSAVEILSQMVKISDLNFDLVLASVYAQGGGFEKTNFFRKAISFFANMIFRSFFNIRVNTLSSFYRVYKISLLKRIKNKYSTLISEAGFICKMEILIKAIRCNASIIEVPMILKSSNRKGKSKMKVLKTSFQYLKFLFKKKA